MTNLPLYNQAGESVGTQEANEKVFGLSKLNAPLVHQIVTAMLANKRNTVASTKTRGEVRGGGKKPWQQKGTGRARVGSIRSPLWRGGGIMFGPRPNRSFGRKMNKKAKRGVMLQILSERVREGKVMLLENFALPAGKTKELVAAIKTLSAKVENFGRNILFVVAGKDENLQRAARNLPNFLLTRADNLNLLDLLTADRIIVLKEALPILEKAVLKEKK